MASLQWKDPKGDSGKAASWYVTFRDLNGKQWQRSTGFSSKKDAQGVASDVRKTLNLMRLGQIEPEPPNGVHVADYIISSGKAKPASETITLAEACKQYHGETVGKAADTKQGEVIHSRHLCRVLGDKTPLKSLTLRDMKAYAEHRQTQPLKVNGRTYPPAVGKTVKKELLTFTQIWQWARRNDYVTSPCPVKDATNPREYAVPLELGEDREQLTWSEIELRIKKEKLSPGEQKELWRGMYLDAAEMKELLQFCRDSKQFTCIVPAIFLAACAGMRQAEIMRARTTDVDLKGGFITVRQRKATKPTRQVPISDTLRAYLTGYLKGRDETYLVTAQEKQLTSSTAPYYFDQLFKGSKWAVLCGYHRLRHSFGSIALSNGGSRDVIGQMMGHSTEEMKTLYQKTYPCDRQKAATFLP